MKPKNKKDIRDRKNLDSLEKEIYRDKRHKRQAKKAAKQRINKDKRRHGKIELENITEDATICNEEDDRRDE